MNKPKTFFTTKTALCLFFPTFFLKIYTFYRKIGAYLPFFQDLNLEGGSINILLLVK